MPNDSAKKTILARRARFLAAALASTTAAVGVAAAGEACGGQSTSSAQDAAPGPCLSVVNDRDATPTRDATDEDAQPQVCLSPLPPDSSIDAPRDSPADAPTDGNNGTG